MRYLTLLAVFTVLLSCKTESKDTKKNENTEAPVTKEISIAEKIAIAHGFENWNNVDRIEFTFAVDRGGKSGKGRAWTWFPKKDSVFLKSDRQEIAYMRSQMDSLAIKADRAFINDKFWLLIPYQLVWDEGTTISKIETAEAPVSKTQLNKITLTYGNEGGYTPGDAYDIYFDADYIIREWSFRKANAATPTMSTTFESYFDHNGLLLARDHKMAQGDFNLNFQNVKVILNQ